MQTDKSQRWLYNPIKILLGTLKRTFVGPVCAENIIPHYLTGYVTSHKISLGTVSNDWRLMVRLKMKKLHLMRVKRKHSQWKIQMWVIFTLFILKTRTVFLHVHALIGKNYSFHASICYLLLLKEFRGHHGILYPRSSPLLPTWKRGNIFQAWTQKRMRCWK